MRKNYITVISIFISCIFAAAVLLFVLGIHSDFKKGPANAEAEFNSLAQRISDAASRYEPGTKEFSEAFIKSMADISDYRTIELIHNGNTIYAYPPAKTGLLSDSDGTGNYERTVRTIRGGTLTIKASIYTADYSTIFYRARLSFILILAGTAAALFLIIVTSIYSKSSENESEMISSGKGKESKEDDSIFADGNSADLSFSDDFYELTDTENESIKKQIEEDFPEEYFSDSQKDEEIIISDEPVSTEDSPAPQTTAEPEPADKTPEVKEDSDTVQKDTVSESENNIIREFQSDDYEPPVTLEEAVEKELVITADTEQDISLVIIRIQALENNSDIRNKVVLRIQESTSADTSVYSYKDDEFAIILNNNDLDEALDKAQTILESLNSLLSENSLANKITIGITARTGRMISGSRLITEADEAEKHAEKEEDSPIIAFRVNPEKYKDFILNNNN